MAVKADLLMPYMDALNEKGFPVSRITVNLSAIGTVCRYLDRKSDALFLEIGKRAMKAAFSSTACLLMSFPAALQDLMKK